MDVARRLLKHHVLAPIALAAIGCGDVSVSPDAAPPDAPAAPPKCDPLAPFGEPRPLPGLDTAMHTEGVPRLSPDELTMYFSGHLGTNDSNVYVVTRADRGARFGDATPFGGNSTDHDFDPSVSSDGLLLLFSSYRNNMPRLYAASRSTTVGNFGPETTVAGLGTIAATEIDAQPFLTADGAELWFTSNRAGTAGNFDIYKAIRTGAAFADPMRVLELNSPSYDSVPMLSADRRTVYFASDRPGGQGYDVWRSHRSTTADGFPPPALVPELSSPMIDLPGWLSPDGCRLYLTSDRAGSNYDIYVAERQP